MTQHKKILWLVLIVAVLAYLFAPKLQGQQLGQEQFQGNEDALASEMAEWIRKVKEQRHPEGTMKRFNQAKSLGCFNAKFTVLNDIPARFKHGVFANASSYQALVRFANASTFDDGEKDLRGMSIRVFDVSGQVLWGQPGLQDFVLNSYPALFAASPEAFLKFIQAQYHDSVLWYFLNPMDSHLGALMILLKARDRPHSPFDIRYWSTTPFRLGSPEQAVKYSVAPCSQHRSDEPDNHGQNYLRAAMHGHLEQAEVCFDFMVQPQTDPDTMPIEDPSVVWDEEDSPFVPVAQLTFGRQEFLSKQALAQCETAEFNPWQAIEAHKPLGRMNYVRRQIYAELAAYRRAQNQMRNP